MFWWIVIGVLLGLLLWLVFAPLDVYINTPQRDYRIRYWGILSMAALPDPDEILILKFRIFFIPFKMYPFRPSKKKDEHKIQKHPAKKSSKRFTKLSPKKAWRMLRTFKVLNFKLELDTGDPVQNAKLFPLFALLDFRFGGFGINFNDHNELQLHLRNRPFNLIKSFINL